MGDKNAVEQVKNEIMNDLFVDVDSGQCIMNLYLKDERKTILTDDNIKSISKKFFESEKRKLLSAYSKGKILLFRKYSYEKILNDYKKVI